MHVAQSEVRLFERDGELEIVGRALVDAASGQGTGISVTGESGSGKTSLVMRALSVAPPGLRVLRVQCDPLGTPRPMGAIRDLGLDVFDDGSVSTRAGDVGSRLYEELRREPTVLVVEDLHWLDEGSAEVLRIVARRVEAAPLVFLVTYRDLEIGARHPARPLLGDLAVVEAWHSLPLRPLSLVAVTEMAAGTELDVERLHALTGGNPFYVTAVVREPSGPIPTTVRDAVLARTYDMAIEDLEALQLIAMAPDGLDDRVLPKLGIDLPTLRRLDETALIVRTQDAIVFRHELGRLAIASTVPPGGTAALHARLLDAFEMLETSDAALLTHHAVGARDAERALRHARVAAAEAMAAGSNSEAVSYLEVALTHLPRSAPANERAQLLDQLGTSLNLTGRMHDAITTVRASISAWEEVGSAAGAARAYAMLSLNEHQLARGPASRSHVVAACDAAIVSGDPAAIAMTHGFAAEIALVCQDLTWAAASARRAEEAGIAARDAEFQTLGRLMRLSVDWFADPDGPRAELLLEADEARAKGHDLVAWIGYVSVVVMDLQHANLRGAQQIIDDVLEFALERDLAVARDWVLSFRALLHLWAGRWRAAAEDCETTIDRAEVATPFLALVSGLMELRQGVGDGRSHLEEVFSIARAVDEPLRYLYGFIGLAEKLWMSGEADERVTIEATSRLPELATPSSCRWATGELAVWLRRIGVPFDDSVITVEPYRSHLDGRVLDAADFWRRVGHPFNEAMSLADSTDPGERVRAVAMLDRMGAVGTADRLRVELRRDGFGDVPQRPREGTRANPGGLTNRQVDVARLVAQGLTNQEIADRLYISPKTADHHVSAILAKLGLPNRRAVARQADELGLG